MKFFIWILIFWSGTMLRAQSVVLPDSVETALKQLKTEQQKAKLLYEQGDALSLTDTVQAVAYINQGLLYVSDDNFWQGIGYFYLGRVYMDFSLPKAEKVFDKALQYLEQIKTQESLIYQSRTWANKAVMAQLNGDNRRYIDLFLNEAIPLAAQGGDSLRMADGYTNVALPFMNYGEYDKALLYLQKAAALFERLAPGDFRLIDTYCYIAKVYVLQDQTIAAGEFLKKAREILKQDPESIYASNFHAIESMYFIKQNRWKEAEQTINKGLEIAEELNNRTDIRQLLYQKSEFFHAQQRWTEAKQVLLQMDGKGYFNIINDRKLFFRDMARLENQLGNDKEAYTWMLKLQEISEEIYNQEAKAKITHLEAKYNYVNKEKELLIAQAKTKKQQAILWITILASALVLLFVYMGLRARRLKTERAMQALKQQQRIELGKALLEGEEKERGRLARDLHDGLGGMLAGIKLHLSQRAAAGRTLDPKELEQTISRLGASVSELRRISRNMMPESLLQSGLETALKDLCDEAQLPGVKVRFRAFDMHNQFAPQVQVMIYRIVQELVYNAIKHAEASAIMVQCSQSEEMFFITVEDNGKGFSSDHIPKTSRGLRNIRNRIDALNGKMDMESSPEGTTFNIELYVG